MATSSKTSRKDQKPQDPRIRSRVALLENLSPELRDLLVFFLDAVLNLDEAIQRHRRQHQEEGAKEES